MLRNTMEKVLICGAGITGALSASLLRSELPDKCEVQLWDKARGAGGRMSTSRSPENSKCTVDLGAQYISASPENYKSHASIYSELLDKGILKPIDVSTIEGAKHDEGTKHFVTPNGVSSLVKYFLQTSESNVKFKERVTSVDIDGESVIVATENGAVETFNSVVLTMPVPQILQLNGSVRDLISQQPDIKKNLEAVSYSSRYALGIYFSPGTEINVPWSAKYITNDDCIRFIAIDNKKRNAENSDVGPSVVVHCSVPFSLKHLEEDMNDVCSNIVLPRVRKLMPELPQHDAVKNLKWRYSQVHKGYTGAPGGIILNKNPLIICGGDGFVRSGFDGCVQSANSIVNLIKNSCNNKL